MSRRELALVLFLLAVYTLSYSGVFHSDDEMSVAAAAESLVKQGSLSIDQLRWNQDLSGGIGKYGADGHLYSKYGWGASVAAVPLALAALVLPSLGSVQAAMLLNAFVTALTGLLVLRCARRLGATGGQATALALIYGLATLAWVYAKFFFGEPLSGLALLAGFYFLLCYRDEERTRDLALAGLAVALAVAVKTANATAVPVLWLQLAWYEWQRVGRDGRLPLSSFLRRLFLRSLVLVAPILLAGIVTLVYNYFRFGDLLDAGYLPIERFSGRLDQGLSGLLLSPGRGLIFYVPVLWLLLPAFPVFWHRWRIEAAVIALLAVSQTLLYARWHVWFGGWCWGPRFLVPLMPFLVLALGPWLQTPQSEPSGRALWRSASARGARAAVVGLSVVSGLVQLLGLSVDFNLYLRTLLSQQPELKAGIAYLTVDDPLHSPLLGQLSLLAPQNLDFAWLRVADGVPWVDGRILLPCLAFLALAGASLWAGRRTEPGRLLLAATVFVGGFAVWQAAAWGNGQDRYGVVAADYERVFAHIQAGAQPGDVMLFVVPERSEILLNINKLRLPVYAPLQDRWPLKAVDQLLMARLAQGGGRLWLVTEDLPDAGSGYEHWLALAAHRLTQQEIGPALVTLYAFPPAGADAAPVERVERVFGGTLRLEGTTIRPWPAQAGQGLQVVLFWQAVDKPGADYRVSLRLTDSSGRQVWQRDSDPAEGYAPTSGWTPGQVVVDRRGLLLPADIPSGEYRLSLVVYEPVGGAVLALEDGSQVLSLGLAVGP